jgi:phosphoadenosine phosphosulfate reductase
MNPALQKKVDFAIKLLRSIPTDEQPVEISYSGGKDSDVILELAKMSGIPYRAIYKNTTIDPPGTIKHCKEKGVEVFAPTISFFDLVKKKGCPTRRARFCCEYLKEYKVLDRAVQGIRRSESVKRAKRYNEPTVCRLYGNKKNHVEVFLPILEWADEDVAQFIAERDIKCHPLYYDEQGNFHVERRLGCIGCPLRSDNGLSDMVKYPKFLKRLISSSQAFIDTHPNSSSVKKFGNAYNLVLHNLFFDSYEKYHNAVTGGMFPETAIDAKSFLEDYFKIDLTL